MSIQLANFESILTDDELKKRIAKPIKPSKELNSLPKREGIGRRVLLIVPPGTMEEAHGRLSAVSGELPMLGLAYIAASLRDQGHDVKVIDYEVNFWGMSRVAEDIRTFQPDVVGMTAYITNMKRCARVAEIVKSVNTNIFVILGGPQVSIFPEEGFISPYVDAIAMSEGEVVIRNVMNALHDAEKLKEVKGIWYRDPYHSNRVHKNPKEDLAGDLDIFPGPAIDLFEMEKYYPPAHIWGKRVAHLLTSRGCPFECTFCETKLTFGRSFRYHSTQRVIEELEHLIEMGYDSFQFYDDIFTINKPRVIELCQTIIDKKWKIQWMCFTRTNCLSQEMLSLMKRSGCYLIAFGAESGDDELLKLIKKSLTAQKNFEGIEMARKHGIRTFSSFMLGLPRETPEKTETTVQFALNSGLDYAVFPITEPYPGTELWVDAKKYGTFDTSGQYSNNLLSENSAVWVPHGRTREELEKAAQRAMGQFYFRKRQLWIALTNFYRLPLKRAWRYLFGGFKYFFIYRFKSSVAGARY